MERGFYLINLILVYISSYCILYPNKHLILLYTSLHKIFLYSRHCIYHLFHWRSYSIVHIITPIEYLILLYISSLSLSTLSYVVYDLFYQISYLTIHIILLLKDLKQILKSLMTWVAPEIYICLDNLEIIRNKRGILKTSSQEAFI